MKKLKQFVSVSVLCVSAWGCSANDSSVSEKQLPPIEVMGDGSVVVGELAYPTMSDFHRSEQFRSEGRRCGVTHEDVAAIPFSASDCSFSFTSIEPEYQPGATYVIPVVVHVITKEDGTGNVSEELVRSQIDILNEDFNALDGTNGEGGTVTSIRFELVSEDPDGNPSTGIYYHANDSWFSDPGSGLSPMKSALGWDTERYFNIYTNDANGALGYATFPSTTAGEQQDGVVLAWSSVGRDAPQGGQYNLGRTATHEVGHYLGLFHTFQGGCGNDSNPYGSGDLIADTQAESGPQFQCNSAPSSCGGGNNPIENYMDYTPDACMNRFTPEQANRMRCSLINHRTQLFSVEGPGGDGNFPPAADFTYSAEFLTVAFGDNSVDADGEVVSWEWNFGDGNSSTERNPVHTYAESGEYTVTLTATDDAGDSRIASQVLSVFAEGEDPRALASETPVKDLSGATGSEVRYHIDVPEGAESVRFIIGGGNGDADLYVRVGDEPTVNEYDHRPYLNGNNEVVTIQEPAAGRYYVMIRAYSSYSGLNLVVNIE